MDTETYKDGNAFLSIVPLHGVKYVIAFRKRILFTMASDADYYERDPPDEELLQEVKKRGADMFTFIERRWCNTPLVTSKGWIKETDNVALLDIATYDDWTRKLKKETRHMIRKSKKKGIRTKILAPSRELAKRIWKIYNETPIRQNRWFMHYGEPLEATIRVVLSPRQCRYIGAYFQEELVGFIRLMLGTHTAQMANILSMQKHRDKAVNNALVAKAVEFCAENGVKWLAYGRMTNHPTLDAFKKNNGFRQFLTIRHNVPLTRRGRIVASLRLHRELQNILPDGIKYPVIIPIYNWISRTRIRSFNLD